MLVLFLVVAGLLLVVMVVAVWQVAADDRAGRAATAQRVIELVRAEDMGVGQLTRRDGYWTVALHQRDGELASPQADSPAAEGKA